MCRECKRSYCRKKQREKNATEGYREYNREYKRRRRHAEPRYKLDSNMSTSLSVALRGAKCGSWEPLVGYTADELMAHLESKFQPGMTWDNYGEWHVDHVIPKSWFVYDDTDSPLFRMCWALSNLQPMWAFDNHTKSNRFVA